MSSTKSSIGHLLGAAGAVEAIFSILAIKNNIIPATINLDDLSIDTKLDLVPHNSKEKKVEVILSNSFGFGGTNASVIFSKYDEN
jgi:3-oxoacyl-[acyl-carrier-protein] synthase II